MLLTTGGGGALALVEVGAGAEGQLWASHQAVETFVNSILADGSTLRTQLQIVGMVKRYNKSSSREEGPADERTSERWRA